MSIFANKLHPTLAPSNENVFYSPHSLLSALGMCAAGAKNETLNELVKLLGVPEDEEERKAYFRQLVEECTVNGKEYELTTANALWSRTGLMLVQEFLDVVQRDYGGSLNEVDFDHPSFVVKKINDWCKEQTKDKIKEIIDEKFIDEDTLLILTNAIYFLGKWQSQFDKSKTKDEVFHNADGKQPKIPMMKQNGKFQYGETELFQVLEMPYQGDDLSMMVLLPNTESTEHIDQNLANSYQLAIDSLQRTKEVHVSFPKFTLETKYELGPTLVELGAKCAFSDYANFSGITKEERLKISEVVHKAFVKCDEEGTEAAAVTAVSMARCLSVSRPIVFIANHPFVFFIRNVKTNTILFVGRIANM